MYRVYLRIPSQLIGQEKTVRASGVLIRKEMDRLGFPNTFDFRAFFSVVDPNGDEINDNHPDRQKLLNAINNPPKKRAPKKESK